MLRTVFLSLDKPSMGKEFEAEGFARPTGRRRIYLGQIAYPKSRTTFWASDRLRRARAGQPRKRRCGRERKEQKIQLLKFALCRPGGHGGVTAPVPIPNTAVKHPCANGTAS